jgi:DNA-binding Lrp family transcriptional regulator
MLPTLRLFKIGVKFDLTGDEDPTARVTTAVPGAPSENHHSPISDADRQAIQVLQQDLPLVPEPFTPWAVQANTTVSQLLERARDLLRRKLMRRFAAVLKHRDAGISANAMGVWAVPLARQDSFGEFAATYNAVSHCYLRTTYPDWPYSIFTMVHAPTREQCQDILASISAESGISDYRALYSSTEYKKTRVRYFTPEIALWEREIGARHPPAVYDPRAASLTDR